MTQFKQLLPLVFPAIDKYYRSAVNRKPLLTPVTARKPYKTGLLKWKGHVKVVTYYTLPRHCTKDVISKVYDNR